VSTTVFGLAVGFFAFFGLTVSSLGLTMISAPAIQTALITTVGLASKAVPTNAEGNIAPSASALKR
jgi:hypothetical protein